MPSFINSDKKMGGESSFITKDGIYTVVVDSAFRDDKQYSGGTFYKYTIEMTVVSDDEKGKMIKGDITKPQDKWATPQDREWGGWNSLTISKYAIGAGLDKQNIQIENVKQLCDNLKGKTIAIEVKLQEAKDGNMYARVVDVFPYDESKIKSTTAEKFEVIEDDEDLPF